MASDLERLLALVRRELGALDARIALLDEEPGEGPNVVSCPLADGRRVAVTFDAPPPDRDAKQRRLEMLASTFDTVVEGVASGRSSRPPVTSSLHDELLAVATRAAAVNAIVIDANSPVVWGAARPRGVVASPPLASSSRLAEAPANDEGQGEAAVLSRRAIHLVRGWPELSALRKGKHARKIERTDEVSVLAHSFAGIYVIVLVWGGDLDELRAERAVAEALPRVERLVLALPPLDPTPSEGGGVVAMRRPRRR